jgi:hypothetical protein
MNRYKNQLIAAAVLSMLAVIGTIMNSRQASAQDQGNGVTIVSPIPLPVTGTVGVASGASVRVNNTVADPVRVRNVNDAIQPFQAGQACTGLSGSSGCKVTIFTVPTGKRAVIEYFSGIAILPVGLVVSPFLHTTQIGLGTRSHFVPTTSPAYPNAPSGITTWGQQVRLYADPGTAIDGSGIASASAGFTVDFTISGYLVDVPFTP